MMRKSIYSKEHERLVGKLKKARIGKGLDQKKAADLLGVSQSYISKIESGQRRIDIIQLKRFAELYNKSLRYFME